MSLGFPQILPNWEVLAESSGEVKGGEENGRGIKKGENIDSEIKEEVFVSIFGGY